MKFAEMKKQMKIAAEKKAAEEREKAERQATVDAMTTVISQGLVMAESARVKAVEKVKRENMQVQLVAKHKEYIRTTLLVTYLCDHDSVLGVEEFADENDFYDLRDKGYHYYHNQTCPACRVGKSEAQYMTTEEALGIVVQPVQN